MSIEVVSLVERGLMNSLDEQKLGPGVLWAMENATVQNGRWEGGPRFGAKWQRTSAHANDVGYGLFYAEFGGRSEYIAILKRNGETTCEAWSVNPATGVWTGPITGSTGMTIGGTDNGDAWVFAQYDEFIYAGSEAAGMWMRRVGGAGSSGDPGYRADNAWREFEPSLILGTELTIELERPDYPFYRLPLDAVGDYKYSGSYWQILNPAPEADGRILVSDGTNSDSPDTYFSIVLPEAQDWSQMDYLYLLFEPQAGSPDITVTPAASGTGMHSPIVTGIVSEDATTTFSVAWASGLGLLSSDRRSFAGKVVFRIDLSGMSAAARNAVRRLVWRVQCSTFNPHNYYVAFYLGGRDMWDQAGTSPAIRYAAAYYNSTTSELSQAVEAVLAAGSLEGDALFSTIPDGGAHVGLAVQANGVVLSQGFDQVKFFRKDTDTGDWHELGVVANSGNPEWIDRRTETEVRALGDTALSFEGFAAGFAPTTLAVWKQHLVVGYNRKLYFSFEGLPLAFLPAPEDDFEIPEEIEGIAGRTVYLSQGRTENATAIVPADVLFAAAGRSIHAMIGDRALEASPPRLLPRARGTLGKRGGAVWGGGAIVAGSDGLWLYEVSRAFALGDNDSQRVTELTFPVRRSWEWLVGAAGAKIVTKVFDDEVWVFCETRYLRWTRPTPQTGDREFETGELFDVVDASAVERKGFRVMRRDGRIFEVGVAYEDDDGTPATWEVETGWMMGARRRVTEILIEGAGTPEVTVMTDDGVTMTSAEAVSYDREAKRRRTLAVHCLPGHLIKVKASGVVGVDTITHLDMKMEIAE